MFINIDSALPGMILQNDIFENNNILIKAGTVLDKRLIYLLKNHGIKEITISIEPEVEGELGNISLINNLEVEETVNKQIKEHAKTALNNFDMNQVTNDAKEFVKCILNSSEFKYDLSEYKEKDNNVFSHSIRVATFAIVLAKIYNSYLNNTILDSKLKEESLINLNDIAVAALLHDTGKSCKRDDVRTRYVKTPENLVKYFPNIVNTPQAFYDSNYDSIYSYMIVNEYKNITEASKLMILLSGENEISTGPLKASIGFTKQRNGIIYASKIIKICSLYDDTLKQFIEMDESLENVVAKLEQCTMDGTLNKELVNLFFNNIPLYSAGIKVILSNGKCAIVKKAFTGRLDIYKPVVVTKPDYQVIDLREETTITIKEIFKSEVSFQELIDRQIREAQSKNR